MSGEWAPDLKTIEWALATIDEGAIGDDVKYQLSVRAPEISTIDRALIGEAAVECVLLAVTAMIREDPGPYGHAGPV